MPPRFEIDAYSFDTGFDKDATPRWQMVGEGSVEFVNLVNAPNLVVKSRNESISTVDESSIGTGTAKREFMISAKSPGRTFIDVFGTGSIRTIVAKLEVFVRAHTPPLNIAFNFVTDHVFDKTKRNSAIITDLLVELDKIYLRQANIRFTDRVADIQVKTSHSRIAYEQKNGNRRKHADPEWNTLIDHRDPGAHINVFFMSGTGMPNKRPSRMLGDEFGNIVCDDGMSNAQVGIALPHMIGRFLRCPVTNDESQIHHLMFETRDEGLNRSSRGRNFISNLLLQQGAISLASLNSSSRGRNFIPKATAITIWETLRDINR